MCVYCLIFLPLHSFVRKRRACMAWSMHRVQYAHIDIRPPNMSSATCYCHMLLPVWENIQLFGWCLLWSWMIAEMYFQPFSWIFPNRNTECPNVHMTNVLSRSLNLHIFIMFKLWLALRTIYLLSYSRFQRPRSYLNSLHTAWHKSYTLLARPILSTSLWGFELAIQWIASSKAYINSFSIHSPLFYSMVIGVDKRCWILYL